MTVEICQQEGPLYAQLSSAGAFYVCTVEANNDDVSYRILLNILRYGSDYPFSTDLAKRWSGLDQDAALRAVLRLQDLGFVYGKKNIQPIPEGRLEDVVPDLLARLSASEHALLADENGFYLSSHGFHHESAEEIAGLSAELVGIKQRHGRLLQNNLRVRSETWALVNPAGQSDLGFWPLRIGAQRFILVIGGQPQLHKQAFVTLVQVLDRRYS